MKNPIPYRIIEQSQLQKLQFRIEALEKEIDIAIRQMNQIREGNLEDGFTQDQKKNSSLFGIMDELREQMRNLRKEEQIRDWVNDGLNKFSQILRNHTEDLKELSNLLIAHLTKYIQAVQGGIFLVEEDEETGTFMDLKACYAYDRQKFIKKRFLPGEGLIGQCYKEKAIIHLREIPDNYIEITSGLGEAAPKSILIVPMIINENLIGMIELSSFKEFPAYHIDFVLKLGENIASSIMTAQNVDRVKSLLEQSQMQTEAMRAQEEEMRQNMEELQATQEEMKRRQADIEMANERMKKQEELLRRAMENTREKEKLSKAKNEELILDLEKLQAEKNELAASFTENQSLLKRIGSEKLLATFQANGELSWGSSKFASELQLSASATGYQHDDFVFEEEIAFSSFHFLLKELSKKEKYTARFRRKRVDDSEIWLNCHYFALLDADREVSKVLLFAESD